VLHECSCHIGTCGVQHATAEACHSQPGVWLAFKAQLDGAGAIVQHHYLGLGLVPILHQHNSSSMAAAAVVSNLQSWFCWC